MTKRRAPQPCAVDTFTLPLFPIAGARTCHAIPPRAQSIIETIRKSCDIDEGGHWIWRGRRLRYGAPCMAYQAETRPVRQVIRSLISEDYKLGMPAMPSCGNPLCVAPGCIEPKRNADLMTEARKRKAQSTVNIQRHQGIWGQLITAGGKTCSI